MPKSGVLITGSRGQLGFELARTSPRRNSTELCDIDELDIRDRGAVLRFIAERCPALVINAAAYTGVDKAESEPEVALAVNGLGAESVALACREIGARLVHISTDFVFDGNRAQPYGPQDLPAPLGEYGRSKLEGEQRALQVWSERTLVLRTSWLYSTHGANFVKTMLRLMQERSELSVVSDQVGTPTWAYDLAGAIWKLSVAECNGILHWSDSGVASWYDFAVAIQEEGLLRGLLGRQVPVRPISSLEYPLPARRPSNSVLDKSETTRILGYSAPHWRVNLRRMLDELAGSRKPDELAR